MTSEDASRWIRRFHPAPEAPVRLVCLPHAGGSAVSYLPLSTLLTPDIEVLAVQYPGRQERHHEPAAASVPELADRITAALRPHAAEGSLALFGHSMGAVLAFEVARRLAAAAWAQPLAALFVSGRRAPSRARVEEVHLLDDDGLVAEIEALGGVAPGRLADEELRQMVLPAVRADYRAIETYRFERGPAPLTVPVCVLIGDRDPRVGVEEAEAWAAHTEAATDVRVFADGGHFYLNDFPEAVAEHIRHRLHTLAPRSV
ncbi:alpha/beta fold hydrolase [Streptomyces sp. NPDC046465]|uniref:thioesterase II family protein n=1 Tax=Streptomyces sp. NPDC046465 TaxID=3155810 RepID=UPI0033E0A5F1